MKTALQKHILQAEEKRRETIEGRRYRKHRNLENAKSLSLGHSGNRAATVNYTRRKDSMKDTIFFRKDRNPANSNL
jgi:hypothetical protein